MSSHTRATGSLRWVGVSHRTLMAWRLLSLDPLIGGGLKWVVKAKCPVVVGEWDFSNITFGHDEGHLVDATISQSTRSLGDL